MAADPGSAERPPSPTSIDAGDPDGLLGEADRLDRAARSWLDGLDDGARRSGRRVAYLIVATEDYAEGCVALITSLHAVSELPVLVLRIGDWQPTFSFERTAMLAAAAIFKADLPESEAKRFRNTLAKLWAFAFVSIDRLVVLDSDCLVRQPIDDLFDGTGFAAAPDLLCEQPKPVFNSGVFAVSPDPALRRRLFDFLPGAPSFDGGDQGILNAFFGRDISWLPARDNYLRSYEHATPGGWQSARIVHYTAKKPWDAARKTVGDIELLSLVDVWTDHLDAAALIRLVGRWRRSVAELEVSTDATLRRIEAVLYRRHKRLERWLRAIFAALGAVILLELAQILLRLRG